MEETGLPVILADMPLTCVAKGGGKIIELLDKHGLNLFDLD
jgi:rod shape-determining protein MreB